MSTQSTTGRCISCLTLALVLAGLVGRPRASDATDAANGTTAGIQVESLDHSDQEALERLSERLEEYRRQLGIPGLAAGIVRNQRLIWAQGFGLADLEHGIAVTPETPFHLASLTKTFASQILLRLVEQGKVDLDDPVKSYGVTLKGDRGITVRHLLTHTSEGVPGRRFRYDGRRFAHLGRVIERASGATFRDLVVDQILIPAGMLSTAPVLPPSRLRGSDSRRPAADLEARFREVHRLLARPYALGDALEPVPGKPPDPDHFGVSTGLISTIVDLASYDAAIDRHRFVSEDSLELAFTPAQSNSGQTLPYGLGWFVQEFAGKKIVWHYGRETGYSALYLKVPEKQLTFILLANSDELSRPFSLGAGDVLNSPFAVGFLNDFAFRESFSAPVPKVDWDGAIDDISVNLTELDDPNLRELLRRELVANLMLHRRMGRSEQTRHLMDTYTRAFAREEPEGFECSRLIASIDDVADSQYRIREFKLDQNTAVQVYALGESSGYAMCDYGGIESARTGELVWEMYSLTTQHAGGAVKNRRVDRILPLEAGTYRLHYRTDSTHAFATWNDVPPNHNWWGIRLCDAGGTASGSFWQRAKSPESLGWSSTRLAKLRPVLENLHSTALMIVTDGEVVFEWGRTANNLASHSTRKSLISALYGIAVAEGSIDLAATLEELGIGDRVPLTSAEKRATVEDLLKARSGVYIPAAGEVEGMRRRRPDRGSHPPGTHWYYNNWDFNVLGTVIRERAGEDIYEAFDRRIANPLGMQDYSPERQAYAYERNFSQHPAYPFLISARDLARFGQLYLDGGSWKEKQIIPTRWVKESTRSYSPTDQRHLGYGYLWWVVTGDFHGIQDGDYYASGLGGQMVLVLPRIDTVVVHRTNLYLPGADVEASSRAPYRLMPRIMAAYTGQRAQPPTPVSTTTHPQRELLPDYAAARERTRSGSRAAALKGPATVARVWLILCVSCLVPWAWQMTRRRSRLVVWLVAVALFGPVGLLAAHLARARHSERPDRAEKGCWRLGLYAALHSLPGYLVAIAGTTALFALLAPNAEAGRILVANHAACLLIGLLLSRSPFVGPQLGMGYWQAARRTALVEVIAVNAMVAGMSPVLALLILSWFLGGLGPPEATTALSWLLASLVTAGGTILLVVSNAWLCRSGFDAALPGPCVVTPGARTGVLRIPDLVAVWPHLVTSLVVLGSSIALSVYMVLRAGYG